MDPTLAPALSLTREFWKINRFGANRHNSLNSGATEMFLVSIDGKMKGLYFLFSDRAQTPTHKGKKSNKLAKND